MLTEIIVVSFQLLTLVRLLLLYYCTQPCKHLLCVILRRCKNIDFKYLYYVLVLLLMLFFCVFRDQITTNSRPVGNVCLMDHTRRIKDLLAQIDSFQVSNNACAEMIRLDYFLSHTLSLTSDSHVFKSVQMFAVGPCRPK